MAESAVLVAYSPRPGLRQDHSSPYTDSTFNSVENVEANEYSNSKPFTQITINDVQRRIGFTAIIPTLIVVLMSAGIGTVFLLWLITHQVDFRTVREEGAFLVDEGTTTFRGSESATLKALTISSVTSHLISVTGPILMSLVAFRVANAWLREQERQDGSSEQGTLPTPLQYGLLIRVLSSSGIMSLLDSLTYAGMNSKKRVRSPGFYKEAILMGVIVYIVNHFVGAVDLWLHTTTHAVIMAATSPSAKSFNYGVSVNETYCIGAIPLFGIACQTHSDSWGNDLLRTTGSLIASNSTSNTAVKVITLHDSGDAAVLVPSSLESGHTFRAQTVGTRATCISLNKRCAMRNTSQDYVDSCANIGYPMIPINTTTVGLGQTPKSVIFGIANGKAMGETYGTGEPDMRPTNPASIVMQLKWSSQVDGSVAQPNDAVSVIPIPEIALYAACNLTVFNGTVEYGADQNYTLLEEILATPNFTDVIWAPLVWQLATPRMVSNVQSLAMVAPSAEDVMAIVNQELARLTLASVGGLFMLSAADNIHDVNSRLLGRYPLVPVLVFVAVLYLYAAIALFIFISSSLSKSYSVSIPGEFSPDGRAKATSVLQLAQIRLTDPLALVSSMYAGDRGNSHETHAALSAKDVSLDMFAERPQNGPERLHLGFGRSNNEITPGFGIWKRRNLSHISKDLDM